MRALFSTLGLCVLHLRTNNSTITNISSLPVPVVSLHPLILLLSPRHAHNGILNCP